MKKLILILVLLLTTQLFSAEWQTVINVRGTVSKTTDVFALKSAIKSDVLSLMDSNATIKFKIDLIQVEVDNVLTDVYAIELDIEGKPDVKAETFATTVYAYFKTKFISAFLEVRYSRNVTW